MQLEQILIVDSLPSGRETIEWALERAGVAAQTFANLDSWVPPTNGAPPSQVAIVSLRTTDLQELGAIKRLGSKGANRSAPVLALGPESARDRATEAGAALFLSTPLYVRDAVNAARIMTAADGDVTGAEFEVRARLALFDGLYQLARTLLSLQRSFIVELRSGRHRGELRFVSGMLSAAHLDNLQGPTALHRMLLWDDGDLVIRARNQVRRSGQFAANPDSLILEADRFLRDFAHEAGDLGTARTVYQQDLTRVAQRAVHVPEEVSPVFRLFDGQRDLAAVVQDSPFPVFDTIRIIRRLAQAGALVARRAHEANPVARRPDETSGVMAIAGWNEKSRQARTPSPLLEPKRKRKITASRLVVARPSSLDDGPSTPPPKNLAPAAMSGEIRSRSPRGPEPVPGQPLAAKTPAFGGKPSLGPAAAAPVAPPSGAVPVPAEPRTRTSETISTVAGEIGGPRPSRPRPVVAPSEPRIEGRQIEVRSGEIRAPIPLIPNVVRPSQTMAARAPSVVVDAAQMPAPVSLENNARPPVSMAEMRGTPAAQRERPAPAQGPKLGALVPASVPASRPLSPATGTPRPVSATPSATNRKARGQLPSNPFDDVESDFFAREADLYRTHAVEDFGDLEEKAGDPSRSTPGSRKP